jgi:uncharacterized protein
MNDRIIKVEALKYDRSVHRSWKCQLIAENEDFWEFVGVFETEIKHPLLGVIRPDTVSYEFYWKNRCFNVFRFHEPEGDLRNFYCNVNLPPVLENNVLSYIDLDIDILVAPDFNFEIVDLEEFEENARKFNYPAEVVEKARGGLEEVVQMILGKKFPFNIETKIFLKT